jgi:subtilisin family serine protease
MRAFLLKKKIFCAITAFYLPMAFSQCVLAEVIELKFDSMKQTVPFVEARAQQHFVRLALKPVSVWIKEQQAQGKIVDSRATDAYAKTLEGKLVETMNAFEALGLKPSNPTSVSDVGFSVFATAAQLKGVTTLEGIDKIVVKQKFLPQRNYSTPWVGAPVAHTSGFTGKGQIIAVIDSGTDYTHKDFGGSGSTSDFEANDPAVVEPGSFPTSKVVGGYDLAGAKYDARFPETSIPTPDADPLDDGSHGTHVSGIAAGLGVEGVLDVGIAPAASIMSLKVFGTNGSTNLVADAIEKAMDPDGDGNPSDAVGVINMSLGSDFGGLDDPSAVASQNANDLGIVVVAAAGNSGNGIPFVSGSPASARDVISVASTISGGVPEFFIPFVSSTGERFELFAKYAGISPPLNTTIVGDLAIAEPYNGCEALTTSVNNKIAVITRGTCSFTTKLQNAKNAGAKAAIVVNNAPGAAFTMGGSSVDFAGAMISLSDGAVILQALSSSNLSSELAADNTKVFLDDDNTLSDFSSRGPGPTGLFKPDVSAPGSSITSALSGSGDKTLTISGTSMATPQVAGMAALLRQKFPQLKPEAIKAIIQNTATPVVDPKSPTGTPPLSLQGTGIINIGNAIKATSYVAPGGIGFGRIKPEYNDSVTRYITIANISPVSKRYSISIEPNNALPKGASSISVNSEVYVGAGQTQRIPVVLNLWANNMKSGAGLTEMDGWLIVKSGEETMRVGYQAVVDPASRLNFSAQGKVVRVRNDAFGDAQVYAYSLAAKDSVDNSAEHAINAFGFRTTSPETLSFGVSAKTNWTNFSRKLLSMSIDTNEDGTDDYLVRVADLQYFDPQRYSDPTGIVLSSIVDLNNLTGVQLLYLATTGFNDSILQFQVDAYGEAGFLKDGDTTFQYELTLTDLFNDNNSDVGLQRGAIDLAKQATFDTPNLLVPAQQSQFVTVETKVPTLWLVPTEKTNDRKAVIR